MKIDISQICLNFLLIYFCSSCINNSPKENAFIRFNEYSDAWSRKDFSVVWKLSSLETKKSLGNNEKNFVKLIKDTGVIYNKITIVNSRISITKAMFFVTVTYSDLNNNVVGTGNERCIMVFEKENWYLSECKLDE